MEKITKYIWLFILAALPACETEELNVPVNPPGDVIQNEIDEYIQENFVEEYNIAVRYRFVDRYVEANQRATPPRTEVVIPMLEFINDLWIEPYMSLENGEEFVRRYISSEIVLLGGLIFLENGTVLLGVADNGARITLTNVNAFDPSNPAWVGLQLTTVYHEFAHVVHQNFKLPVNFEQISPSGYTSPGSWFNLPPQEALQRGFVTPYATSSPNEDFAETVAAYLYEENFNEIYIEREQICLDPACEARNEGRARIEQKLDAIRSHYLKVTGVDLDALRAEIQSRL